MSPSTTAVNVSCIQPFENIPKMFIDPIYNGQKYCLVSFIPSRGAQPDADGVFGMSKVRGVFQTAQEANDRAEWLIRNVDQNANILTTYVGRPYPICLDTKEYIEETNNVDLQTKINTTLKADAQEKREKDMKAMNEIKEREKELVNDTSEGTSESPLDIYIMNRAKRAHLIHTFKEYQSKLETIKKALYLCDNAIKETECDEFKKDYMERYHAARKEVGCPGEESFMKYLDDDRPIRDIIS
jgi:hypothetical protein